VYIKCNKIIKLTLRYKFRNLVTTVITVIMAVSDKITNYNCLRERERKSYLVEATNDNLARLALQHQQSGPEPFEIQVKIRKALEKKLDPVQPGSVRPGRERVRIGLHVVGVDDEDRVEEIGGLGGVLESRIVVDPQAFPEPHERRHHQV
jgi:hypothetical protein